MLAYISVTSLFSSLFYVNNSNICYYFYFQLYILTSIICFTDQAAALENLILNHDESRNRIDDIQSQLQQTTHDVTDSYRSNQGVYTTIHYNNDCTL